MPEKSLKAASCQRAELAEKAVRNAALALSVWFLAFVLKPAG